jgi:hypothetical protein
MAKEITAINAITGPTATLEGNVLVYRIPVNRQPTPSSTGKTLSVASSNGNKPTAVMIDGQNLVIGFNAYIYPSKAA